MRHRRPRRAVARDSVLAAAVVVCGALAGCAAVDPIPAGLSDAEVQTMLAHERDVQWAGLRVPDGTTRPSVAVERFTTLDTWSGTQVDCLRAAGLDAREVSGGFVVDGTAPDDATQLGVAIAEWECSGRYPRDPRERGYLTADQELYRYDFAIERIVPCLRAAGASVAEPPDRDDYISSARSGTRWDPYADLGGAAVLARAACPAVPFAPSAHG